MEAKSNGVRGLTRMITKCCVNLCNSINILGVKDPNLVLHKLPKEEIRREKWLDICCRKDLMSKSKKTLTTNYFVCSNHFLESDYIYSELNEKTRRLKKAAIPSIFGPECYRQELTNSGNRSRPSQTSCETAQTYVEVHNEEEIKEKEEEEENESMILIYVVEKKNNDEENKSNQDDMDICEGKTKEEQSVNFIKCEVKEEYSDFEELTMIPTLSVKRKITEGGLDFNDEEDEKPVDLEMDPSSFYGKSTTIYNVLQREQESSDDDENEAERIIHFGSDNPDIEDMEEMMNITEEDSELEESQQDIRETIPEISKMPRKRKEVPLWRFVTGEYSAKGMPEWLGEIMPSEEIKKPIAYFKDFFSSDILEHLVEQSNLYASQENPNKPLKLDVNELEQFIGTLLAMSMVKLSNSRLYWSSTLQCPLVTEVFSRVRWEEIKSNLHCNDNSQMPLYGDTNYDKLYKIRPLVDHLQSKFRNIPMPQMLCVDEQIVPFKGKSTLKNYIPMKPHKWGFKIFALCDTAGILYDFHISDGPIKVVEGEPDLGASSNIVLQLTKFVPVGKNHLLYHDNWFTSLPLVTNLAKKQIYCLGTVRQVRLSAVPFPTDKELMKESRGTYKEISALVDDVEVRVVKWKDNKCVNLLSTFSSALPLEECKRFDKKKKAVVMIPCPAIVKTYNKFMGGVDLMDALLGLYRIHIRSKKYYHKLIFHFIDVSVINAWLLYKRDCKCLGLFERNIMKLQAFKMSVAKALLIQGKCKMTQKRGRPSISIGSLHAQKKRRGNATQIIPGTEIRSDGYDHMPEIVEKSGRCKHPTCKGITVFFCSKCKVNLCITKNRNCFKEFHKK